MTGLIAADMESVPISTLYSNLINSQNDVQMW